MFEMTDTTTRTVSITGVEVLALKKLAVICGALASKIGGQAAVEQRALTKVLVDVINQLEGIR